MALQRSCPMSLGHHSLNNFSSLGSIQPVLQKYVAQQANSFIYSGCEDNQEPHGQKTKKEVSVLDLGGKPQRISP